MNYKYDISLNDPIYIIDLATRIFFWKFCIISKDAIYVPSLNLLISLNFCQAQFQSSPVQLELRLAVSLIITTPNKPTQESRDAAWYGP